MKKYSVGIPDEKFIRGKVPMTKEEIRILTLAKARIGRGDMVADIGAGTGSISCEAALQATDGKVFAIERKSEGIELIKANAEKFGIENLHIIQAEAPEGWSSCHSWIELLLVAAAVIWNLFWISWMSC